jgi:hypothetical protein
MSGSNSAILFPNSPWMVRYQLCHSCENRERTRLFQMRPIEMHHIDRGGTLRSCIVGGLCFVPGCMGQVGLPLSARDDGDAIVGLDEARYEVGPDVAGASDEDDVSEFGCTLQYDYYDRVFANINSSYYRTSGFLPFFG